MAATIKSFPNLINGIWKTASATPLEDRNPADYNEVIGHFPMATLDDTKSAIQAAREAFPAWSGTPAPARGAMLDRASQILSTRLDEIAAALTREEGKTLAEAKGEVARARDILKYFAGEGWRYSGQVLPSSIQDELLYTRREPLGVVSIITPWNFPIAIPAWKIAPALAYGNTVVFKPAEDAPHTALLLVEVLVEAGLPSGVLNFLTGDGELIGTEMTSNPHVNGISFTGSQSTGTKVYQNAIKNMARVQLEMGGKNALVILKDADLELAVKLAITGGFGLTGQACTATSRIIVEEEIADTFVQAFMTAAKDLKVGNGLEEGIQMGPLVNRDQLQTSQHYIALGQQEGARLLLGGEMDDRKGYFAQPTIFDQVEPSMRIAQEEIFGPVVGILRVKDLNDAIEKANAISFGLSAGVVTNDLKRAFAFANEVDAGVVKINEPTTGIALNAPFGGFKGSSANTFKEQGQAAVDFYTRTKTIYVNHG